jgi:hypothetical protein
MKEILMKTFAGGTAAVSLTLKNSRPGVISMRPKAFLVRYEPSNSFMVNTAGFNKGVNECVTEDVIGYIGSAGTISARKITPSSSSKIGHKDPFQASPSSFELKQGAQVTIDVTFTPAPISSGVYTGVLKIKAGKKVSFLGLG